MTDPRRCFAEEAEPHNYEPMITALDLMASAFNIPTWRDLIYNESLTKEMEAYTGMDGLASQGKVTPDALPHFMKE